MNNPHFQGTPARTYTTRGYPVDLELRRAARARRRSPRGRGRVRTLINHLIRT